jgi:phosphoenolpyruvate phosphomutase
MKAIILAAGIGSRLMPETHDYPKALLKLDGKAILDIELENLTANGINDIIIVTGHKHETIERYVTAQYPHLNITFVMNRRFAATNYIYSLWLTRDLINDAVVIMHGDIVFESSLLGLLLDSPSDNAALINNVIEPPEKDFKAVVNNGVVERIGVGFFGKNAFFCAPIYKFALAGFSRWLHEIDTFITDGIVTCYAEEALNNIAQELELGAVYYGKEFCMEIDTPEDLDIAREHYAHSG